MFRTLNHGQTLSPDDVFHHWSNWREISRDEAATMAASGRVVIVFRNGSSDCADWFEPDHPFFRGVGPHSVGSVRYYYRYRDEPIPRSGDVSGAASAAPAQPAPPKRAVRQASAPEVEQKTWIEIELLDPKGVPVPGEGYTIRLPDGTTRSGTLDSLGRARVDGIDPGVCDVSFPGIDKRAWRAA
jgi:hypothetical protein